MCTITDLTDGDQHNLDEGAAVYPTISSLISYLYFLPNYVRHTCSMGLDLSAARCVCQSTNPHLLLVDRLIFRFGLSVTIS